MCPHCWSWFGECGWPDRCRYYLPSHYLMTATSRPSQPVHTDWAAVTDPTPAHATTTNP